MNSSLRIAYWDNWKGLAIIAVVAIHATNTASFAEGSFNWLFGLTFRQLINFAVPVFFALAGYFSVKNFGGNLKNYYKKRLFRILIPYAVWTAIFIFFRTPSTVPGIAEIVKGYLLGTGIGIGYFVIVLTQFIALTPVLNVITKKSTHIIVMLLVSFVGCIFTYYFFANHPGDFFAKFPINGLLFFVWYPFYHFGYFVEKFGIKIRKNNSQFLMLTLPCLLILAILEGLFWAYRENYRFGVSQLKASSFFVSLALFTLILYFQKKRTLFDRGSFLTWLGGNSYAIYLIHLLFLGGVQSVLKTSDRLYNFQPFFIFLSILITLSGCTLVIIILRRLLPSRISQNILG